MDWSRLNQMASTDPSVKKKLDYLIGLFLDTTRKAADPADPRAAALLAQAAQGKNLGETFDPAAYTSHVDAIFERLHSLTRNEEGVHV